MKYNYNNSSKEKIAEKVRELKLLPQTPIVKEEIQRLQQLM